MFHFDDHLMMLKDFYLKYLYKIYNEDFHFHVVNE